MAKQISEDELTRLAFIYAEQDRHSFAESWPKDAPERKEAARMAESFRKYRTKRWGRTGFEADMDGATLVNVDDLRKAL